MRENPRTPEIATLVHPLPSQCYVFRSSSIATLIFMAYNRHDSNPIRLTDDVNMICPCYLGALSVVNNRFYPVEQLDEVQKANMAAWARLQGDPFFQIASRLPYLEEVFRLKTVCKSCNSTVNFSAKPSLSLKTPVLMLVEEKEAQGNDSDLKVKAYTENTDFSSKIFINVWRLEISPPQKRCFGVKYGWLLTVGMDLRINLIHPVSEHQISLPPCPISDYLRDPQYHYTSDSESGSESSSGVIEMPTIKDTCLWKAAMSSNPLENITNCKVNDECVVLGIFSDAGMLAFAKLKDKVWTVIKSRSYNFVDVIFFKGRFFCINNDGALFVCIIEEGTPKAYEIASIQTKVRKEKFLVEVSGELCVVIREFGSWKKRTVPMVSRLYPRNGSILMYRLAGKYDPDDDLVDCFFKKKRNLGSMSVMVGASSVSLDARGIKGCFKRNRVFVTDDKRTGSPFGMDVFDEEDDTFAELNFSKLFNSLSPSCPPFWYT